MVGDEASFRVLSIVLFEELFDGSIFANDVMEDGEVVCIWAQFGMKCCLLARPKTIHLPEAISLLTPHKLIASFYYHFNIMAPALKIYGNIIANIILSPSRTLQNHHHILRNLLRTRPQIHRSRIRRQGLAGMDCSPSVSVASLVASLVASWAASWVASWVASWAASA